VLEEVAAEMGAKILNNVFPWVTVMSRICTYTSGLAKKNARRGDWNRAETCEVTQCCED
jgi:hypothetical protein